MNLFTIFFIIAAMGRSKSQLNLTIFHNTDMYSRFEETLDYKTEKMIGGFARLAQILEKAREESNKNPSSHVLYLNAGNTFTGTYLYHIFRWKIVAKLMNVLNPDAVALGSQEFVDGLHGLEPFLDAINFPVLASNIIARNGSVFSKNVHASIVLNVSNVSIGIIGYASRDTQVVYPVGNLQFTDELEAVQKECRHLNKLNVTIVIGLGNADLATDLNIARKAECLDALVGGDSTLFLWNDDPNRLLEDNPSSTYPMVIKNVKGKIIPLLEGYSKTRYVGKIDLTFDSKGNLESFKGSPILLNEEVSKSDKVGPILKEFTVPTLRANLSVNATEVVAKCKVYLGAEKCRQEECNLGNMITDALIEYKASKHRGRYWSDTPIALINAGSIRKSINTSTNSTNITRGDIEEAMPFKQSLITVVLQGVDLKHTLEVGARYNGETRRGEFLVFSGIRVKFDLKRPPFKRVISVLVRCGKCKTPSYAPLNVNNYYRIVTTVFLASGGDGHTDIRKSSLSFALEGMSDVEATINYLQTYKEVRPECDDRIVGVRFLGSHQRSIVYYAEAKRLVFTTSVIVNFIYSLRGNILFY